MERIRRFMFHGIILLAIGITVLPIGMATATTVVLNVPGYGYNTIDGSGNGYDGLTGSIGCGPTTGAMIMGYWTNNGAPGLITNSLDDARLMGAGSNNPINTTPLYMNTNSGGFGPSYQFQFGFESFAASRGYDFNAAIHKNATDNPAVDQASPNWNMYTFSGPNQNIVYDVNFWNTTTWQINQAAFIAFIKAEIDAGRPLSASVAGDPKNPAEVTGGGASHWMPIVGYNDITNEWAGLNTWDNSLHWYTPTSAFFDIDANTLGVQVPNMSIAYVRTFDFEGPIGGGPTNVPEPSTMILLGSGLIGLIGVRKKFKR